MKTRRIVTWKSFVADLRALGKFEIILENEKNMVEERPGNNSKIHLLKSGKKEV